MSPTVAHYYEVSTKQGEEDLAAIRTMYHHGMVTKEAYDILMTSKRQELADLQKGYMEDSRSYPETIFR